MIKAIEGFPGYWIEVQDAYSQPIIYSDRARGVVSIDIKYRHVINPKQNTMGYYQVGLYRDGKMYKRLLSRLVAEAFIPKECGRYFIDHIDTNPLNNCISNLRWCTRKENQNNELTKVHFSVSKMGIRNPRSRSVVQYAKDGSYIREWLYINEVESELGIAQSSIVHCCRGKIKTAGGYVWRYKEN